jgi:ribose 5-phosphate isomerase B
MTILRLALGSDHAGFLLKEKISNYLKEKGYKINDFGCFSEERADYADYGHLVAGAVERGEADFGVLLCGSGNGINMSANKHKGIRAALCWKKEIAALARFHNDANIITLPARYISEQEAFQSLDVFLSTPFEGGRHTDRVLKIDC